VRSGAWLISMASERNFFVEDDHRHALTWVPVSRSGKGCDGSYISASPIQPMKRQQRAAPKRCSRLGRRQGTGVVAVWVMKMAANAIVHVIAVRHRLMAAAGAVHMAPPRAHRSDGRRCSGQGSRLIPRLVRVADRHLPSCCLIVRHDRIFSRSSRDKTAGSPCRVGLPEWAGVISP